MGYDEADGERHGPATGMKRGDEGKEKREGCGSVEDEEKGRRDVVRSARLNYPDVLAQIRLPVYAHNTVRNVQSTGNHHPPPSLLLLLRRHSRRCRCRARRKKR